MNQVLAKTAIICATIFFSVLILGLAAIAILKGDGSESLIVTMMVGMPTLFLQGGVALAAHYFGAKASNKPTP